MSSVMLEHLDGPQTRHNIDSLVDLYRSIFTASPWNEGEDHVTQFRERLHTDCDRPGFQSVLAHNDGQPVVFGTAWLTPETFPETRGYAAVKRAIGERQVEALLCGSLEIDELGTSPTAQGMGVGKTILQALSNAAPDGRCWLLTWTKAPQAIEFYERSQWRRLDGSDSPDGVAVFLGPEHPAHARTPAHR